MNVKRIWKLKCMDKAVAIPSNPELRPKLTEVEDE